jgi:serine O-acetyltransferase
MSRQKTNLMLNDTIRHLAAPESLQGLFHEHEDGYPLPSSEKLEEIVQLARAILFPGYFGKSLVNIHTLTYQIGVNVEKMYHLLCEQVLAGLCFSKDVDTENVDKSTLELRAHDTARELISRLPEIRRILGTDVIAAYNGDPAAKSVAEIIACYPVIKTLTNYRVAHELCRLGVPIIPRLITELAHSETGIDIHPGATIGEYFTIDHGTGVVIGETCRIGRNVKLYQGVTLGAKSFPLDKDGNPIKGIPRHPIIGDNVIIYANATILGRITIGHDCVIGANVWVTHDMKPGAKKYKQQKKDIFDLEFNNGTGI